jgi:hypothetical protein
MRWTIVNKSSTAMVPGESIGISNIYIDSTAAAQVRYGLAELMGFHDKRCGMVL